MRNVDKYLTEIVSSPACIPIKRLRTDLSCDELDCDACIKANKEWLEAECVEPEVDWSKVPMGTPVRVWDRDNDFKQRGRYVVFRDDMYNLRHEVLVDGDNTSRPFKYAELIEVDNESNTND